ncbi:MAG: hypothetical protein D6751_10925 [Deltaproteobacteria bacterium]|nr:MAG: hypothetical protein D6751_10925 [Deltaproteobacteria bacterium]
MSVDLGGYRKRIVHGPWTVDGVATGSFHGAVVIPALNEAEQLPATLTSLAANPAPCLARWLVLVVVNRPGECPGDWVEGNRRTLDWLRRNRNLLPHLGWIDASRDGLALPGRFAGAGLARKIGFDLALDYLAGKDSLLVSLDADTLVQPDYLPAIESHFAEDVPDGATLPFRHQPAQNHDCQQAIDHYELYLRHQLLGLKLAGSPYAYASIGSAFACRVRGYLAAGGLNRRKAGEDFYFLQQLAKTGGVRQLQGTCVHPSPRVSDRVPFGTGEKIERILRGERPLLFATVNAFDQLKQLLAAAGDQSLFDMEAPANDLPGAPGAAAFLVEQGWPEVRPRLCRQHRSPEARLRAFHTWFDALRSWQLLRVLSHAAASSPLAELDALMARSGLVPGKTPADRLEQLRRFQQPSTSTLPPLG